MPIMAYKNAVPRTVKQAALLIDRHSRGTLHTECEHLVWVTFPSNDLKLCHECRVEMHDDGSYLGVNYGK
jgi:hypothetical protein